MKLSKDYGLQITKIYYLNSPCTTRCVQEIIEQSCDLTRIYVLLTGTATATDIARQLSIIRPEKFKEYALLSVNYDDEYYSVGQRNHLGDSMAEPFSNALVKDDCYRNLLILSSTPPTSSNYSAFCDSVLDKRNVCDFNKTNCRFAVLIYDAMMLYANALNELFANNGSLHEKKQFRPNILNQTYESRLGFIDHIDSDGEAGGNYTLLSVESENKTFRSMSVSGLFKNLKQVGLFHRTDNCEFPSLELQSQINWLTNNSYPPLDQPKCGFSNEKCGKSFNFLILLAIIFFIILLVSFICFIICFIIRFLTKYEKHDSKQWEINLNDVYILDIEKNQDINELNRLVAVSIFRLKPEIRFTTSFFS